MDFSNNLQLVMKRATEIAAKNNHEQMAPSHLLLAIIQTKECKAYQLMETFKASIPNVEKAITLRRFNRENIGNPTGVPNSAAKSALNAGREVARQTGSEFTRTEHLLIGLLSDGTLTKEVFRPAGVNPSQLINHILKSFGLQPSLAGTEQPGANREFDELTTNLNKLASEGKLDPVIGRTNELKRAHQILARRRKNNPVLIGDAGVGKTAIAEGLAQSIVQRTCPACLQDKVIYVFDLVALINNTVFRGQLEGRVKAVLDHCKKNPNIILFIDEIHLIVGAGDSIGGMDFSNMVKAALSRGEIRVLGATTEDEYNKSIAKDSALERRFQPIHVGEPSDEDTLKILQGIVPGYEKHHGVKYSPESLAAAIQFSKRYIPNRRLPDKAIDVLDEAGSAIKLAPPRELVDLDEQIERVRQQKIATALAEKYTEAEQLLATMRQLQVKRDKLVLGNGGPRVVTEDGIRAAVSIISQVPVEKMTAETKRDSLHMADKLAAKVIGQRDAVERVARYVKRGRTRLNDPKKPLGSLLFLGPTGVGKTLLARALAAHVSGKEENCIQLDMSEFMEKFSVSRLIGSPPGYVGYEDQNTLVERVRRCPYAVVLFDEIEKAHQDVWNILLQILEDGKLTDGLGRVANFRNTFIIMTSNLGYSGIKKASIGFNASADDVKDQVMATVKKEFRPEMLNRIDEIVVFNSLTLEDCSKILDLEVEKVRARTQYSQILLSPALREQIIKTGFSEEYGGRALKRTVELLVSDAISDALIAEEINETGQVYVAWENGKPVAKQMKAEPVIKPEEPLQRVQVV